MILPKGARIVNIVGRLNGIGLGGDGNPEGYLDVYARYAIEGEHHVIYLWVTVPFLFSDSDAQLRTKGLNAIKADVLAYTGLTVPIDAKIRVFGI